jgi:hypothetical protein
MEKCAQQRFLCDCKQGDPDKDEWSNNNKRFWSSYADV